MNYLRAARDLAVWAVIGCSILLGGCAVTLSRTTFPPTITAPGESPKPTSTATVSMEPVSKSGVDVFTVHFQTLGLWYATSDPTANGMPTVNVRWLEAQVTRDPGFPAGYVVPSVSAETHLDATTGAHVFDRLSVGMPPAPAATP